MEDRKTALAIIISTVIIIVYSQIVFAPYQQRQQQIANQQAVQSSPNAVQPQSPGQSNLPVNNTQPAAAANIAGAASQVPSIEQIKSAGVKKIEADKFAADITLLGGRFNSLILRDFKDHIGAPEGLNFIHTFPGAKLPLGVMVGNQSDIGVTYSVSRITAGQDNNGQIIASPSEPTIIELKGILPDGASITKRFKFQPNSYLFDVEIETTKPGEPVWLEWTDFVTEAIIQENLDPKNFTMLTKEGDVKHLAFRDSNRFVQDENTILWSSVTDKYFISAIVPLNGAGYTLIGKEIDNFFYRVSSPVNKPALFRVYTGPKDIDQLRVAGLNLERSVDLGFFSFLAQPLLSLLQLLYKFLGNYGLAIIALTLLIKLLFLPLTKAGIRAGKVMQAMQPEIKELKERIKDSTQLNQEMMALYKRRGVNPVAGCFPMLIQIPVFLGLYQALLNSINLRHAPFALWINDLSSPEKLKIFGIGFPLMILLMGASMYFQQKLQPTALDPQQQKIMNFMPIIFTGMFILHPMPSGLVLYWLVSNVISITQQTFLRNTDKGNALTATLVASVSLFSFGYILTLM